MNSVYFITITVITFLEILYTTPYKTEARPPDFLERNFSVKGQFLHIIGQITHRNGTFTKTLLTRKSGGKDCILRGAIK